MKISVKGVENAERFIARPGKEAVALPKSWRVNEWKDFFGKNYLYPREDKLNIMMTTKTSKKRKVSFARNESAGAMKKRVIRNPYLSGGGGGLVSKKQTVKKNPRTK